MLIHRAKELYHICLVLTALVLAVSQSSEQGEQECYFYPYYPITELRYGIRCKDGQVCCSEYPTSQNRACCGITNPDLTGLWAILPATVVILFIILLCYLYYLYRQTFKLGANDLEGEVSSSNTFIRSAETKSSRVGESASNKHGGSKSWLRSSSTISAETVSSSRSSILSSHDTRCPEPTPTNFTENSFYLSRTPTALVDELTVIANMNPVKEK